MLKESLLIFQSFLKKYIDRTIFCMLKFIRNKIKLSEKGERNVWNKKEINFSIIDNKFYLSYSVYYLFNDRGLKYKHPNKLCE